MEKNKKELVRRIIKQDINALDEDALIDELVNTPVSVDVLKEENENLKLSDRAADKISNVAGSWTFIIIFISFLIFWFLLNTVILKDNKIDPYPFILLNLLLSCIAALQAPIIMMSQNREAKKDRLRNENDYRTDLKSELILEDLHKKMDTIINNQNHLIKEVERMKKQ